MFNGFPSTQTPTVQWWDYSKSNTGTNTISLANDCAPVQFFATGGSTTAINLYLPSSSAQGKTIIIKNDSYVQNVNQSIIVYDTSARNTDYQQVASVGAGGSVTLCYIAQNTLAGRAFGSSQGNSQNWVIINNTSNQSSYNYFSTNAGGYNTRATSPYATVSGGLDCYAINTYCAVGGGTTNSASGVAAAITGGQSNNASGNYSSISGGSNNIIYGSYATVSGGYTNTASTSYSIISGGAFGTDRAIIGSAIFPACNSPISANSGVSQGALLVLAVQTTDATATVLRSNTSAASSTNQVIMPNNSAYYFRGECIAGKTGAGDTKGWYIEGVIKRGVGVGTTALVGTPTVTSLYADAGAATWAVTATADTTNGGLAITVTGQAATTIRWVCQIRTTEMTF